VTPTHANQSKSETLQCQPKQAVATAMLRNLTASLKTNSWLGPSMLMMSMEEAAAAAELLFF
jgi:hypothetical protein